MEKVFSCVFTILNSNEWMEKRWLIAKNGKKWQQASERDSREQIIDTISSRYRRCAHSHHASACGVRLEFMSSWKLSRYSARGYLEAHKMHKIYHEDNVDLC